LFGAQTLGVGDWMASAIRTMMACGDVRGARDFQNPKIYKKSILSD